MQEKNSLPDTAFPVDFDALSFIRSADAAALHSLNEKMLASVLTKDTDIFSELAQLSVYEPKGEIVLDTKQDITEQELAKLLLEGNYAEVIPEEYSHPDFGTFEPYPTGNSAVLPTKENITFSDDSAGELETIVRHSSNLVRALFTGKIGLPEASGFRYWFRVARDRKRLETFDWGDFARMYDSLGGETCPLSTRDLFTICMVHDEVKRATSKYKPPRNTPVGEMFSEDFYSGYKLSNEVEEFLFPWNDLLEQTKGIVAKMKPSKVGKINEMRLACGIWLASQPDSIRGSKEWALMKAGNTALDEFVLSETEANKTMNPLHVFIKSETFARHIPEHAFMGILMNGPATTKTLSYFWQ
jgi:hypothetical protein